jgi:hypothetical protein
VGNSGECVTKLHSQLHDNDGCCERCNKPAPHQIAVPVLMGGFGPSGAWGTMWMCPACIEATGRKPPDYMPPDAARKTT